MIEIKGKNGAQRLSTSKWLVVFALKSSKQPIQIPFNPPSTFRFSKRSLTLSIPQPLSELFSCCKSPAVKRPAADADGRVQRFAKDIGARQSTGEVGGYSDSDGE